MCYLHKEWLGEIYEFAGTYRTVNMSKDGFLFAAAHLIPRLMLDFEKKILQQYMPASKFTTIETLSHALAIVHVEFILIHPFREGNRRLGRLLCSLMALQAGRNVINYKLISEKKGREAYFHAIQRGVMEDYRPMIELFEKMLNDDF